MAGRVDLCSPAGVDDRRADLLGRPPGQGRLPGGRSAHRAVTGRGRVHPQLSQSRRLPRYPHLATVWLHAFADAHPLTPRGVKEALERVKMLPAASGAPGTRLSFGKWTRRGWVGAGYLVARQLEPEFGKSRLVGRFGEE